MRVEDESFDREVGEVSKTVGLRMRLTASVLTVPVDGLNKLAENAVEAKIPAGATLVPGSIKLGAPSEVSVEGNTITFRAEAQARRSLAWMWRSCAATCRGRRWSRPGKS